jgi:3-deoxy-D-manno-octulosonic-acid transferase
VGETIAAKPLIDALISQYPDHRVLVTSTTPTGSEQVRALFADRVSHLYFPYDLPEIIYRFLGRLKPQLLIIVETEIWPNLYASCQKRGIPLMIVNARLSSRSTQSYLKIKPLVAETLAHVDLIAVRSEEDADRFRRLGANSQQVKVVGNIKFDIEADRHQIEQGRQRRLEWGEQRLVWVAASTHRGEDEELLSIYQKLLKDFPDLLLIIVPRHPERFEEVFQLCDQLQEMGLKIQRHSQINSYKNLETNIVLGDSMGEMQSWFACADVVFMGGSLVETGGHNPLEATVQGIPVVSGQYMFNFEDIANELTQAELLFVCKSRDDVQIKVAELLALLDSERDDFARKAKRLMQQHRGVTARLLEAVSSYL